MSNETALTVSLIQDEEARVKTILREPGLLTVRGRRLNYARLDALIRLREILEKDQLLHPECDDVSPSACAADDCPKGRPQRIDDVEFSPGWGEPGLQPDPLLDRLGAYRRGVEQMLTYEQAGGDGWWKGWEALKAVYNAG